MDEEVLYGISYDCPVITRSVDCPLKEIDAYSFLEKVEWIKKLTTEEKRQILEHHKACSDKRLYDVQ